MAKILRNIPSVNELLESPPLRKLVDQVSHHVVVGGVRDFLDNLRGEVRSAAADIKVPHPSELAERIAEWILQEEQPPLRPVINATGILLHTGLGRAPLAEAALRAISETGHAYASVELDLASGQRSQRLVAVERLLRRLTGAEAAVVVNNNAAATLICLAALAGGRDVIVSRGQLIEIGGSYRLPDVMAQSGARLHEVGTTNKTRLSDYEQAIGDHTAALMRVHTSNYKIVGFTEDVALGDLVELGRRHQLPVIDDIGSGALIDFSEFGVQGEPVASESIRQGADVVLFSGDKLLGGPQCGILVGKQKLLQAITRHPLMRAFRVDKITLAALAATLRLYRDPQLARQRIPLLALLSTSPENLHNRAERLAPQIAEAPSVASAEALEDRTFLGGGAVPTQDIPTWCIAIEPGPLSAEAFAAALRRGRPAVVGRVKENRVLLDLRSVFAHQDGELLAAVEAVGTGEAAAPPPKP